MKKKEVKAIPLNVQLQTKPVSSLPAYKCCYCGNEWIPRTVAPKVCPNCHRSNYLSCNAKKKRRK